MGAAIFTEPFVKEDGCEFLGGDVGIAQCDLNISAQPVHHCDDGVETIIFREWANEVDCYRFEMFVGDREGVQGSCGLRSKALVTLTFHA